ncbi:MULTISPECIES: HmuY family protein [unclassified Cupriavidus]|uniref:HmuY family protein n=1 Tax=unclassified Cupriavidus TaxID=2640874 RepID=UPI001C00105F|nr:MULTISPECIES: HmuY family protein [unclassified Cupriavidus]MCA3187588.1 HmuY family protein [Cupriavidus sp.]MCA3193780.1 HmuY family protein [Cupriavidus sp.]MCA3196247.1 HmuY family protein [Cupriavidus sp.]MCA3203768.1 HmuY family protein [Cupriavidus sp.]MCA3205958.1 HmuY family protein [Cupriavidus sp.]
MILDTLALHRRPVGIVGAAALALTLAACGGDGGGGGTTITTGGTSGGGTGGTTTPPAATSAFTQTAEWTFALPPAGNSLCYDFNTKAQTACTGSAWDLKVKTETGGRSAKLWTNSGTSGTGNGGAFGSPFDHTWTALSAWKNATTDPVNGALPAAVFLKDSASGVFASSNDIGSATFEYGVTGAATDHLLYPTFRTFVITTNSTLADTTGTAAAPVFALQVTGYYGGAGGTTSGYPSFRFVDRSAPATVYTATVNASADWVYYDLVNRTETTATGTWHIAFNRYNVKLNGGESGTGTVAGFLGKTPAGFYDASNKPVASAFTRTTNASTTLADLTAADMSLPTAVAQWVKDSTASVLNPAYTGAFPNPMDFGWYTYFPTAAAASANGLPAVAHVIRANPEAGGLIRGGEGATYARFHVTKIAYADPNSNSSQQTWTINFDVQP